MHETSQKRLTFNSEYVTALLPAGLFPYSLNSPRLRLFVACSMANQDRGQSSFTGAG